MTYIDAVVVKGTTKGFSVSINVDDGTGKFIPLDLSDYAVKFCVLGSNTAEGKILVEHIITQNTDFETEGQIDDAANGQFTFVLNKKDQENLDLGCYPIMLQLLDAASLEEEFTLTEGGYRGEFNKIQLVQV